MGVTLGSGWQPRLPPEPEVLPDPTLAVLEAVALLREGLANLPVPVVHVAPQDLTDIVTAVSSLHGPTGPSASDIAAAVREALAPSLEREEPETARKMLEALERLDFRMKGQGMSGVGGTVATISSISDVVRTKPEPGFTWPVSGTVATSGLTDAELRATPVPISGSVTVSDGTGPLTVDGTVAVSGTVAVTGPLTDTALRATPVPISGTVTSTPSGTQTVAGTVALDTATLAALESITAVGPLTNTELRATPLPVSGTVAVSGTVPVSGPLTDTALRATPVPISGTVAVTGALTDTQLRATAVPVSLATAPTTPVTGTFWQTTQPVSAATLPLPTGAAQNTTLTDGSVRVGGTVAVQDKFSAGEILADQVGAGAVLTFTFTSAVQMVWVRDIGATLTNVSRADPFGGTPTATLGIAIPNGEPTPLTITTSSVKVYAPVGSTISVYGYRY